MFATIDRILRGEFHDDSEAGERRVGASGLLWAVLALGAIYGAFMGLYAVLRAGGEQAAQMPSSIVKVPLLFLATQVVTIPSLYVFATLAGARLAFGRLCRLMLAAVAMSTAILASLGPVTAFFTLSTNSHEFMVVLNVIFFGIAGVIGVGALNRALGDLLSESEDELPPLELPPPLPRPAAESDAADTESDGSAAKGLFPPSAEQIAAIRKARRERAQPRSVLRIWLVMHVVVGAQMSWIMRPFIGDPEDSFRLFSPTRSNFLAGLFEVLGDLFG